MHISTYPSIIDNKFVRNKNIFILFLLLYIIIILKEDTIKVLKIGAKILTSTLQKYAMNLSNEMVKSNF